MLKHILDLFENEEENENIIEKSDDEPEPVKVKPTFVPKNKRRKAVEKTYEDDEGFIGNNINNLLILQIINVS